MFYFTAAQDGSGNTGYSDGSTFTGTASPIGTTDENLPFGTVNGAFVSAAGNFVLVVTGRTLTPPKRSFGAISVLGNDDSLNYSFNADSAAYTTSGNAAKWSWAAPPITAITVTIGVDGGTTDFGYMRPNNFESLTLGSATPTVSSLGTFLEIRIHEGADNCWLIIDGGTAAPAQSAFGSMVLTQPQNSGYTKTLASSTAVYTTSGTQARWQWNGMGQQPNPAMGTFIVSLTGSGISTGNVYTMTPTQYPNTQLLTAGTNPGTLVTMQNQSDVSADTEIQTLAQLQQRMLIRTGYAAQVSNPPPGILALVTDFLQSSQRELYRRWPEKLTRRFFRWTMEPGFRFYDLSGNDENRDPGVAQFLLSTSKVIEWVGVQDPKGTWTPLFDGIAPELYTMVTQYGRPVRYEIRNGIEVFPAPDTEYNLWIKAHFKLLPFATGTDVTTINSEAIFLHALACAKAHMGQPDADKIMMMSNSYIGELCAGTHNTKRYVPGAQPDMPIVKPTLIQFDMGTP